MKITLRLFGIGTVFVVAAVAWQILGETAQRRIHERSEALGGDVQNLWGGAQEQRAPELKFSWSTPREAVRTEEENGQKRLVRETVWDEHDKSAAPAQTRIDAALDLSQRLKGLVWYSLYDVSFSGRWQYRHAESESGTLTLAFRFPDPGAMYDDFKFIVDGKDLAADLRMQDGRVAVDVNVVPGQVVSLAVSYKSRGQGVWRYTPAASGEGVTSLRDFRMTVRTNFAAVDFPAGTMSPSLRRAAAEGQHMEWAFAQVLTGHGMGVVMPERIQPGVLAAELAKSGPVSLLLFFLILLVLSVLRGLDIHPVNYFALAAAFFSFHLLFAYTVDHTPLGWAFALASAVSIGLVVSYLRLVVSPRFAFREAAAAQLVYQVGFSLAHFWKGQTGLAVTVLAIATLFVLMQLTGRIRWSDVLSGAPRGPAEPPPAPVPAAPASSIAEAS